MEFGFLEIKHIAVIGAGTMGHGIAGQAARVGYTVTLIDVDHSRVMNGLDAIGRVYAKGVARGKMTEAEAEAGRARLKGSTNRDAAVGTADLIIEAVPEIMEIKRSIFSRLDVTAPDHAIFASNTSSLPITEIAASTTRPDRVVGMHFFNPVAVMPLLEIVRGEFTRDDVLEQVRAVGDRMGKTSITVVDSPGFAASRLGIALGNEAMRMFQEGVASAADIDRAMTMGYKHPIGPLALTDLVGLDVRLAISEHLFRELGSDTFRPPQILKRLVRAGKLGRKTGQGFYTYD